MLQRSNLIGIIRVEESQNLSLPLHGLGHNLWKESFNGR